MTRNDVCMIVTVLSITAVMAIAYVLIIVYAYGLPEDFFDKGRFITNTEGYEYVYNGIIFHLGVMVSPPALFATIAILALLFSMMGYAFMKEYKQ